MNNLLLNERPIFCLPSLAISLGSAEKAMFVQQLHFWLIQKKPSGDYTYGLEDRGVRWIKNTVEDWRLQITPWITKRGLEKIIKQLRDEQIVLADKIDNAPFEATLSYTINYAHPKLQGNTFGGYDTEQSSDSDTEQSSDSDTEQSVVRHQREKKDIITKETKVTENPITIRKATASPNPSDPIEQKGNPSMVSNIRAKAMRKANKGAWRNGINQPYKNTTIKLTRDEGLLISLTDNVPDTIIKEFAKKYDLTYEDVEDCKQNYINWIMGSSYDPKVWGKDMGIYVSRFCAQKSAKAEAKDNTPKDMFEEINAKYKQFPE